MVIQGRCVEDYFITHQKMYEQVKATIGFEETLTSMGSTKLAVERTLFCGYEKYEEIKYEDLIKSPGHIFTGKKVYAKLMVKPFCMNGIHSVLEFDNDNSKIMRLALYEYPLSSNSLEKLEEELPLFCKVMITNPHYKVFQDYFDGIRIDDPRDFVLLPKNGSQKYREDGNDAFKRKDYQNAYELYCKAHECDKNDLKILNNRCQVLIQLEEFERAIEDADKVIKAEKDNSQLQKAYYRKAKCMMSLERYDEGIKVILDALKSSEYALFVPLFQNLISAKAKQNLNQTNPVDALPMSTTSTNQQQIKKEKPELSLKRAYEKPPLRKWRLVRTQGSPQDAKSCHTITPVGNNELLVWGGTILSPMSAIALPSKMDMEKELRLNYLIFYDISCKNYWQANHESKAFPSKRTGHTMTYLEDSCYLVGGSSSSGKNTSIWRLDLKTLKWFEYCNLKFDIVNHCSVALARKIWVFGGCHRSGLNYENFNDLFILDPFLNSPELLKVKVGKKKWPAVRSSAAIGSIDDRFFVLFGGDHTRTTCLNDLWLFDTKLMRWTEISSEKTPTSRSTSKSLCPIQIKIQDPRESGVTHTITTHLVLLGGTSIAGNEYSDIWVLDLWDFQWHFIPTLSQSFTFNSNCAVFVHDSKSLIQHSGISGKFNPTKDVFQFPIGEVLEQELLKIYKDLYRDMITKNAKYPWMCLNCNMYCHPRKCSKCNRYSFCSEKCEKQSEKTHLKDCIAGDGDTELKLKKMEEKIHELTKQLMEEEIKKMKLKKELEDGVKKTTQEYEENMKSYQMQMDELNATNSTFAEMLNDQVSRIHKMELESESKSSLNLKLKEKLSELKKSVENKKEQENRRKQKIHQLSTKMNEMKQDYEKKIQTESNLKLNLTKELEEINIQKEKMEIQLQEYKKQLQDLQNQELCLECSICMENPKDTLLTSCGHMYCNFCVSLLESDPATKGECPQCRVKIKGKTKAYI